MSQEPDTDLAVRQRDIHRMIANGEALTKTLSAICRLIEQQSQGLHCSATLLERETEFARLKLVAAPHLPTEYCQVLCDVPVHAGAIACGRAAFHEVPIIVSDLRADATFLEHLEVATRSGILACWSFPLFDGANQLLGTLDFHAVTPGEPSRHEQALVSRHVLLIALAIERSNADHLVTASYQHHKSLFLCLPDAVCTLDIHGNIFSVNPATLSLTGFMESDLVGKHYQCLVSDEESPHIEEVFSEALLGIPSSVRCSFHRADGSQRAVKLTTSPIKVDGVVEGVYIIANDIRRLKHHESELRLLEQSIESSVNGVIICDAQQDDMPITYANAAFQKITGYEMDDLVDKNCRLLQGEKTDPQAVRLIHDSLKNENDVHVVLWNYRKDGSTFLNDLYIFPVHDEDGMISHYIGVQHDITERNTFEEDLAFHRTHDALTQLPDRRIFEKELEACLLKEQLGGDSVALLYIDLDNFKQVNDGLGHVVGDQVLIQIADRIKSQLRTSDMLSRFGGDEFLLLLGPLKDPSDVLTVANRLLVSVAQPYLVDDQEVIITASIGIATSQGTASNAQDLMTQADMAMLEAKRLGRNTYHYSHAEMSSAVKNAISMRLDIQQALSDQQFQLFYQPLVSIDGRLKGFEALLRWEHPTQGFIPPSDFIPVAEETGQIIPISRWVVDQACHDLVRFQNVNLNGLSVAVNLSPLQFLRHDFMDALRTTLESTGAPSDRLTLELTEGILMDNTETSITLMNELTTMGIKVSIDDFGTGYSSLSYLKRLPISTIKIDRSFITDITTSTSDAAIVHGVIDMAHHLGLDVVAEGIENEEQRDFLAECGCDVFQGFLFSRPMPFEEAMVFAKRSQ